MSVLMYSYQNRDAATVFKPYSSGYAIEEGQQAVKEPRGKTKRLQRLQTLVLEKTHYQGSGDPTRNATALTECAYRLVIL